MSDDVQLVRENLPDCASVSTMWSFQTCGTTASECPCSKPALPRLKPPKPAGPGAWPHSWL